MNLLLIGKGLELPFSRKLLLIMKLTGFLIVVTALHVSAKTFSQKVNIKGANITLHYVFETIEKQTGYQFVFRKSVLNGTKKLSVDIKEAEITDALQECLKGQQLNFKITPDKFIVITPAKYAELQLQPLNTVIPFFNPPPVTGTVRGADGQPLAGANVVIKGTNKGVTTDNAGEFVIDAKESDVLIISSIGFVSIEIAVSGNKIPTTTLQKSESKLDEVQIIAYGQTTKRLNTGNVTTVKAAEIEQQPVSNPILALQGRVAGMEITQSSGLPGSSVKVLIRGRNTIDQGTDPLYIVDGVPFSSTGFGGRNVPGINAIQGINPLSYLNPQDIESIEILKDADATAIYGSRGANGVVLITTKKGKAGKAQVNANIQSGIGKISRKAKLMNTEQFLEMRKEAFANDGITPDEFTAKDLTLWDQHSYTDWQDFFIGGTARYNDIQATLSGGNANTQYSIGSNYHKETTVFPGKWSDRKSSVHFNISTSSLNQKFKAMLSGTYLSDNNQLPHTDLTGKITLAPNAPNFRLPDGSYDWKNFDDNPLTLIEKRYQAIADNLTSNAMLSYTIADGLEIKSGFGYNTIQINENLKSPISAINPIYSSVGGLARFNTNTTKSWVVEPQITYKKNIWKGKLDALFGLTIQQSAADGQIFTGMGYTSDELLGSLAAAGTVERGPVVAIRYKYNSGFARLGYNLQDKYLINLTARRDGSSRFGPGKQFGNFGAVGAGWIFSNETFIKNFLPIISYGKLRGSYGTSGNEPADNYQYFELYNFQPDLPYSGGVGINPLNFPAPDFSWEINRKLEAGIEVGIVKDRAILSVSYYRNRSPNQLVSYITPTFTGFGTVLANLPAIVQNRGWEITLNTINVNNHHFSWKSNFNFSSAQNRLVAFPDLENSSYRYQYDIGQPLTSVKVFSFAGVDPQTGVYNFYDKDGKLTFDPQPQIDNTKHTNLAPKYYGGLQNNFRFKQFQLDLNIQYVKQVGYNYLFAVGAQPGYSFDGNGNQSTDVLNRWQKEGDIKPFQKFTTQYSSAYIDYATNSDIAFSDASFIRFKTIALSYNFPEKILRRMHAGNLNIYLHAQNLITISGYKGIDPENQSLLRLPPLRILTAGIQITL
jgi:TonB-dependent starch-binding outer membrane protein SusC